MKFSDGLQKFISFGYVFLIALGVLKESVCYYQLGINILKYSALTDILVSPIADLTSNPIIFTTGIVMLVISYAFPAFLAKRSDKKWVQKIAGLDKKEVLTSEEVGKHFNDMFVVFTSVMLMSFFIGRGLGDGKRVVEKIQENKITYDHRLYFNNGGSEAVYLIGTNSIYYFYIDKTSKNIKITPIGTVKTLEIIENKRLK